MESGDILKIADENRKEALQNAKGRFNKIVPVDIEEEKPVVSLATVEPEEKDGGMEIESRKIKERIFHDIDLRQAAAEEAIEKNIDAPGFNIYDFYLSSDEFDFNGLNKEDLAEVYQEINEINRILDRHVDYLISKKERERLNDENAEVDPEISINKPISAELLKAQEEIITLQKEVEEARKEYLEVDYQKNTALKRVREYFWSESTFKSDLQENRAKYFDANFNTDSSIYTREQRKSLESDADVAAYRAYYDNSLLKLRDAQIAEAKLRNASDAEIADIYGSFLAEQQLKVLEMHDDVRSEHLDGKIFRKGVVEFSKDYRSWSLTKKLGVAAAFAGLAYVGAAAATVGVASAGAITGTMLARRMIMASLTGFAVAESSATKDKNNRKDEIEKRKMQFQKAIEKMSEEEKFELLRSNTWDIAIRDEGKYINEIRNKDFKHFAKGAVVGVFLGSGLASDVLRFTGEQLGDTWVGKLTSGAYHSVKDYFFGHTSQELPKETATKSTPTAVVEEKPIDFNNINKRSIGFKVGNSNNVTSLEQLERLKDGNFHSTETGNGIPETSNTAKELNTPIDGGVNTTEQSGHANEVGAKSTEGLKKSTVESIKAGSPVVDASIKVETVEIKQPESGSHGRMRHDSFIKSLKEHITSHDGIDKAEAGDIAEVTFHDAAKEYANTHGMTYDQAYAKLSRIHPGTTYEIKWNDEGHPKMEFKDIKFVDDSSHHHAAKHVASVDKITTKSAGLKIPVAATDNETYKQWNKEVIDAEKVELAAQSEKHSIASSVASGELLKLDPNSPNFRENLGYANTLSKAANSDIYNWGPSYEVGRLGEVMKHSQEHMRALLDMPDNATFSKIGRDFFDNKKSNILKFGGMNVREALNDPDNSLKGLSTKAKNLIIGYANSDVTKPKPAENFKVWSYRIMTLARRSGEYKLAA
ncbi:MAG: hypothetical protein US63_C0015G0005 [Candidatus Moranbacteria bacterium GW2011_GWC2_37_8]|nr:MAG: hypothetical protein US63_C0015G0005 [Candidatus Moranbacteria bacterium GW2011_GWC2_37_8]KKQ62343.1 MAG: hypothetical protein US82_C0013G0013 [Parcubacteria group bacterium GW2011_GWC1_38_22]